MNTDTSPSANTPSTSPAADIAKTLRDNGVTVSDLRDLIARGKTPLQIQEELKTLTSPQLYPAVVAPALRENHTILTLNLGEVTRLAEKFREMAPSANFEMVIPAGGAATRQTQLLRSILHSELFEGLETPQMIELRAKSEITKLKQIQDLDEGQKAQLKSLEEIASGITVFWESGMKEKLYAFYHDLAAVMRTKGLDLESAIEQQDIKLIARYILEKDGLNYGATPKLLMKLHSYPQEDDTVVTRYAMEEHIREAALLMKGAEKLRLHFIISPEHQQRADTVLRELLNDDVVKWHLGECGFQQNNTEITFSHTDPATDSVALDLKTNLIARGLKGEPLLRNAGHGTVLGNLSARPAEGLWLQNVDNVQYENPQIKEVVVLYKRVLAALAGELQEKSWEYLQRLVETTVPGCEDPILNGEVIDFLKDSLQTTIDPVWLKKASENQISVALRTILMRPLTVAGFVPLEDGQTGGGPFILEKRFGDTPVLSASIVEQAEFKDGAKDPLFRQGEFFNPVMLFISRKAPDGSLYQLEEFSDPTRSFRSEKPGPDGNLLRTLERPGLWNGSIAKTLQVNVALPSCLLSAIKNLAGKESFLAKLHQPYHGSAIELVDFERHVVDRDLADYLNNLGGRVH